MQAPARRGPKLVPQREYAVAPTGGNCPSTRGARGPSKPVALATDEDVIAHKAVSAPPAAIRVVETVGYPSDRKRVFKASRATS